MTKDVTKLYSVLHGNMEWNGSTGHLVKLKQKIWWNNSSSPLSYQTKLFTVMTYLFMTDYTIH